METALCFSELALARSQALWPVAICTGIGSTYHKIMEADRRKTTHDAVDNDAVDKPCRFCYRHNAAYAR